MDDTFVATITLDDRTLTDGALVHVVSCLVTTIDFLYEAEGILLLQPIVQDAWACAEVLLVTVGDGKSWNPYSYTPGSGSSTGGGKTKRVGAVAAANPGGVIGALGKGENGELGKIVIPFGSSCFEDAMVCCTSFSRPFLSSGILSSHPVHSNFLRQNPRWGVLSLSSN